MTFRAKPVVNRPHRSPRDSQNRRNLYLNIGFGVAVVVAVLILVGVVVVTWYSQHLATAASVGGQVITRDDFSERVGIEVWRLQQQSARIQAAAAAGRMTKADADSRVQQLSSQAGADQLGPLVVERLIDARIQAGLAAEEGITVSPEQIDAKIAEENTAPEERHAWVIAVAPVVDEGKDEPTAAQKAEARKIADKALADVTTGGKPWEEIAKTVSTDSSKPLGGDLGWIDKHAVEDKAFLDAIFVAEPNKPTAVVEGEDGTFRIGRVTEIAAATPDSTWEDKLADAGIKPEDYREVIQADVVRQALEDKVVADASKPGPQRQVLEIAIQAPQTPPSDKALKVRHILYSPKDDPQGAADLPAEDPEWTVAGLAARKAYDELKKDPTKFDAKARADSDEASAKGDTGTGGKLPYIDDDGQFVQEFVDAVLNKGLKPGDIIEPVKTQFGWHVIQVMYGPPDVEEMKRLSEQAAGGADFKQLARDFSDGSESGKSGDRGWVSAGILDARQLRAIFAAPVDGLSEVVDIPKAGAFLYKVVGERTQAPDKDQLELIKTRAFQNWYGEKKDAVAVTREILDELTPAT